MKIQISLADDIIVAPDVAEIETILNKACLEACGSYLSNVDVEISDYAPNGNDLAPDGDFTLTGYDDQTNEVIRIDSLQTLFSEFFAKRNDDSPEDIVAYSERLHKFAQFILTVADKFTSTVASGFDSAK